jgi:AAA+ ATPase superfamily predicted ATPase
VTEKPEHVFDREREWAGLNAFAANVYAGAMLGVVSGRRRQGKSFLLEALTAATGGLYFPAVEATEAVSLRSFTSTLVRQGIPVSRPVQDWDDAIALLLSSQTGPPRAVVIDEFPFLVKASPSLPSIIQRELGPGGSGRRSSVRLLLCGSAMSVMGQLLAGQAPLRGRASLELLVRPFGYRDAARFWNAEDPELAALLHAIVGGTPAYRREFVAFDAPDGRDDFDAWVLRTVLNRQSPLFREARYLLAEETEIRDPGLYHSVLGAIASGNHTNGAIARYVGRKSADITHPLNVLEDAALIAREADLFRAGRWLYQVTEPLITFYEVVMRPEWFRLEAGYASQVWHDQLGGSERRGQPDADPGRRRCPRTAGARRTAPDPLPWRGQVGRGHDTASRCPACPGPRPAVSELRRQRLRARLLFGGRLQRRPPRCRGAAVEADLSGRHLPRRHLRA